MTDVSRIPLISAVNAPLVLTSVAVLFPAVAMERKSRLAEPRPLMAEVLPPPCRMVLKLDPPAFELPKMPVPSSPAWAVALPAAALSASTSKGAAAEPMRAMPLRSPCCPIEMVMSLLRDSRPVASSTASASLLPFTVEAELRPSRAAVAVTTPSAPMLMSLVLLLPLMPRAVMLRLARALSTLELLPMVAASATALTEADALTRPEEPELMAVSLMPSATRPALEVASLSMLRAVAFRTPSAAEVIEVVAPLIRAF